MRRRNRAVTIMMTENEYAMFQSQFEKSGKRTYEQYGLDALLYTQILPQPFVDEVKKVNVQFAELNRIERGIGTNINQIAHRINSNGYCVNQDIKDLIEEFNHQRAERNRLWQSTRLLLTKLQHVLR